MSKIGRNDPCLCGSGQKYKRCCLPHHEAAAAERAAAAAHAAARPAPPAFAWEDDGLDDASNRVVDLVHASRLDEAEQAARDLLARYPDVHDGVERLALVYEARGDRTQAAEYYRKALAFMQDNADRYDPEGIDWMRTKAESMEQNSPLRWICKSTRALANALTRHHHPVSHTKVAQLLHGLDYSLQSNRKTEEGRDHPDRDAQFRHIAAVVKRCLAQGSPVISVDTKKKELIGNYANAGQQWLPAKQPRKVRGHDFPTPDVPRAYPYGIYDVGRNTGFAPRWIPPGIASQFHI